MPIEFPDLDPRNESEVVADVIDALPNEITDRNAWTPIVKVIEAMGAFYAGILFYLNSWTLRLQLSVLNLLGINQGLAKEATAILTFFKDLPAGDITIPAGTVIKDVGGIKAVKFSTDFEIIIEDGLLSKFVPATAVVAGLSGNVESGKLAKFDQPITGIASVGNGLAATGGTDDEPIASMIARAPLEIRSMGRCITEEDFELHALKNGSVVRAKASGSSGSVGVFVLTQSLNATPDPGLNLLIRNDLESKTTPGVNITVIQAAPRLISFPEIEIKPLPGYDILDIRDRIKAKLIEKINSLHVYSSDGYSIAFPGWDFGKTLFVNELIAAIDQLEGVDRVGTIFYSISQTQDPLLFMPVNGIPLVSQSAGFDGIDDDFFGLLHFWDSQPISITVLF